MRALNLLRDALVYRKESFSRGLKFAGYKLVASLPDPRPGDLLLIWNRYGYFDAEAKRFEHAGADVAIAENGYLRDGIPGKWFALARNHHSGAGRWNIGDADRFNKFGCDLLPFRIGGSELVILGQRGIGEPGIAAPRGWAEALQKDIGGRVRAHPGNEAPKIPLESDLKNAGAVVVWSSAAAFYALLWGIPLICAFPRWIGAEAGIPLSTWLDTPGGQKRSGGPNLAVSGAVLKRSEEDRLEMFRKLAWAQWNLEEIEDGTAFTTLLRNQ